MTDRRGGQHVPFPLRRFREQIEAVPSLFDADDWGACGRTDALPAAEV